MLDDLSRSGVYTITNLKNGCLYVGGTTMSFKARWRHHKDCLQHGRHGNAHLQRAWNKYGKHSFVFSILEVVPDPDDIDQREQCWLDFFRDTREIYNMATVVGRPPAHPFSEETCRKIRDAAIGRVMSKETRLKISIASKGRRLSETHKQKIGDAQRGKKHTEESKRKMSKAHKGYKPSQLTRLKMSRVRMGRPSAMKGRKHSLETKWKIGQAQLGRKKSEEHKQKISAANQGHEVSTKTRQRIANRVARPYPAFLNLETREIIPAGYNLKSLCEKYSLSRGRMWDVMRKRQASHKGWILWEQAE